MVRLVATAILLVLAMKVRLLHGALPPNNGLPAPRTAVTCMLVFGDSTVDSGNNNHLATTFKANFPPYGRDFFRGLPSGRFSNGRLPTDFIAEALGISKVVPAFLDPDLKPQQLPHGVSFASGSSGYDDLTANMAKVLPLYKQIGYLMHYKLHLARLVGEQRGEQIVNNALFLVSAGTNDFIHNYYMKSNRSTQFTEEEYENYLITNMMKDIKEMKALGARRVAVVGVPPLGCLPIVRTLIGLTGCSDKFNNAAVSFNSKVRALAEDMSRTLGGMRAAYVDVYGVLSDATKNPKKYGLAETAKGCCGSGMVEFGETCKGKSTCQNPDEYLYWDAVHPSQKMYRIIADEALAAIKNILIMQ